MSQAAGLFGGLGIVLVVLVVEVTRGPVVVLAVVKTSEESGQLLPERGRWIVFLACLVCAQRLC